MIKLKGNIVAHTSISIQKRPRGSMRFSYMNPEDKREMLEKVGDAGFILFSDYVSLAATYTTNVNLEDTALAKLLGWSSQKVSRTRRRLEEAGYFKRLKLRSKNRTNIVYYIGKQAVRDSGDAQDELRTMAVMDRSKDMEALWK